MIIVESSVRNENKLEKKTATKKHQQIADMIWYDTVTHACMYGWMAIESNITRNIFKKSFDNVQ